MAEDRYVAYVGTYTHGNSVGIHIYDVDEEKHSLKQRKVVPINNPSDLIVSTSGKYLYSIADEGVESFRILPDGDLEPINEKWIGGMRGCYVDVDEQDRYLFVGGFHDGRVTMMKLNEDGSIEKIADGIFHKGMGQCVSDHGFYPHVTCVKVTPDQTSLCAVDSGLDQVKVYNINYEEGKLELRDTIRCDLDSGPRMIRFSKNDKYAYILCERKNSVEVYKFVDSSRGKTLKRIQSIPTVSEEDKKMCSASGIEFTPDGKYLLVSNAGTNCVAIFEVNDETGELTMFCHNKTGGDYPKCLDILPDNEHFVVLNNGNNEIAIFHINYDKKYFLMDTKPIPIDKPNCIFIHKL